MLQTIVKSKLNHPLHINPSIWPLTGKVTRDPPGRGLTFSTCLSGRSSLASDVAGLILLILMASTTIAGAVGTIDPFPFFISKTTSLTKPAPPTTLPSDTPPSLNSLHQSPFAFRFDLISPCSPTVSPSYSVDSEVPGSRIVQKKSLLGDVAAAEKDKLPVCSDRATSLNECEASVCFPSHIRTVTRAALQRGRPEELFRSAVKHQGEGCRQTTHGTTKCPFQSPGV